MPTTEPEETIVSRDVMATEVPYGFRVPLMSGTKVTITQSLGGWFTLMTDDQTMLQIAGKDADAIGKDPSVVVDAIPATVKDAEEVKTLVWEQLRTCYDPEIPVNIADLGLIYRCEVQSAGVETCKVEIDMTLTAPGCGMGEFIAMEVRRKIRQIPTVGEVTVEMVFDPPWSPEMLPEAARLELGLL